MDINSTKKLAKHIFRLLKVNEIVFPIGRTNKGNLGLKFTESSEDFEIYLDAVPLPVKDTLNDENNIDLKKMLEKYWFEDNRTQIMSSYGMQKAQKIIGDTSIVKTESKKQRGRPKGSKNKNGNIETKTSGK